MKGNQKGIKVLDDPTSLSYPMPILSEGKNDVFVGRVRKDESQDKSLNLWIVADNLRKGQRQTQCKLHNCFLKRSLFN